VKRVFFILTPYGSRRLGETDFPLRVGGEGADIVVPELPENSIAAHIALSDGHAFVQAAHADIELFHNHEYLQTSAWLKSGDRVQIGERVLCWEVKGDQVFISLKHIGDKFELQPPPPPPARDANLAHAELIPVISAPLSATQRRRRRYLVTGLFGVLSLVALFVLFATPLAVSVRPEPETLSVTGFPPPLSLGRKKLVVPGTYTVRATRHGYQPLEQDFAVTPGGFQSFDFEMQELPGRLQIVVDPAVPFRVATGGQAVALETDNSVLLTRGPQQISIETERYLPETRQLDIAGFGAVQQLAVILQPAWATVRLDSVPAGATVSVEGENLGVTPLMTEIMAGQRTLELALAGYKTARLTVELAAGSDLAPDVVVLQPNDGKLLLSSRPDGATVSVDGSFQGSTPVTLLLPAGVTHQLRLSLPGYQVAAKKISLKADEEQQLSLELTPEFGVVFARSEPADASLAVDGKPAGRGTQRLSLTTRNHELTFSKPGFLAQTVTVLPRVDTSQNVEVVLKTQLQVKAATRPAVLRTAGGQEMLLLEPQGSFAMGSSRREAGHRANESQRLVEITRPYYLSVFEVTNAEYRQFDPGHTSGSAEGVSLNGDANPVVNVSWDDAARYCNWLSARDNLEPAYAEQDGRMQALAGVTQGYRLPSEAEWGYAARIAGRPAAARYPWGDGYPPAPASGNFADAQIADTLANVVTGYNDGYRASSPVGSFGAQPAGFHDLGGNVAEWINDYYAVYPGQAGQLVRDPVGPTSGEHRVVRDSSWRDGSITELRLSYRDYSRVARDNLGFRIARNAND